MRGKICFMVVSVMLAVSTGFSHDISGYAYESPIQPARMIEDQHDIVAGDVESLEMRQEIPTAHIEQATLQVEGEMKRREDAWAREIRLQREKMAQASNSDQSTPSHILSGSDGSVAEEQDTTMNTSGAPSELSERDVLARIVMAEAGTEDLQGKIMVANVILNRIAAGYGSSVSDIIFATGQFEPISNGSYWSVTPTQACYEAADRAMAGEDYSQGSLYFVSIYGDSSWFMEDLTYVTQHGGHLFFR